MGKPFARERQGRVLYRACQKNVPIEDRFSAANPYAAILFSEHYYDKRYKIVPTILLKE
jgi:hypothetical protein